MVISCLKRKEIISNKRKEEREGILTYTEATKKNTLPTNISHAKIPNPDTHITIIQCMYHAHFENMVNPGSYEKVMNVMFKANNLPTLKIPVVPQSNIIIAKVTEAMENNAAKTSQQAQPKQAE